jgi:hypothetical protein
VMLAATAAVSAGSSLYHSHPDDASLFWDRLPMTVVFMALMASTVGERVSLAIGRLMWLPLIALGLSSALYWRISGDLRAYALVQFGSMLAMPFLLGFFPPRYSQSGALWFTLSLYGAAKLAEHFDYQLAAAVPVGGHPIKHLLGAAALFIYIYAVRRRCAVAARVESQPAV